MLPQSSPLHKVEISASALRQNVAVFRELAPRSLFLAVVKSNAYGHGLAETVQVLSGHVDWFGVNSLAEARAVRQHDATTPILIMGLNAWEADGQAALGGAGTERGLPAGISFVVSGIEAIQALHAHAPGTPFHLKVDTGLARLGTAGAELDTCLQFLREHATLPWAGLMTHFANVEDVTDQSYAQAQLDRFREVERRAVVAAGARTLLRHTAASAPALILPESRLDMIRVGISLYGLWPSPQTKLSALSVTGRVPGLRQALRWVTHIVHMHRIPAGSSVGYGCTVRVERDTQVAVLPVGYYEGYERGLSNRSYVLIRQQRARLLGRVSMNMIVVDVTHIPGAAPGEEAVLLGRQGAEEITADHLGELTGTINYEVVTRINAALPRLVVT